LEKIVFGKPEGKRQLRRARRRWQDNIRMYLKEIACESVDWIHLAQDVGCEHGYVFSGSMKGGEFLDLVSDLLASHGGRSMELVNQLNSASACYH
jgi:hypothetical protein